MNVLKLGARGNEVIQLQLLLNGHLSPQIKLKNDGVFGKETEKAVKAFQKKKGMAQDGIVGLNTWRGLGATQNSKPQPERPQKTIGAPWYDIAVAEIGVKELLGKNSNNKRIIEYHSTTTLGAKTDEVPWCSSFVNWVIKQSGFDGTNNALAKSWETWGTAANAPRKGDIVVIKRKNKSSDPGTGSATGYHVGFYVTSNSVAISILGGNQDNQVKKSSFMLRSYDIVAYRRPISANIGVPLNIRSILQSYALNLLNSFRLY